MSMCVYDIINHATVIIITIELFVRYFSCGCGES